jgi:deoxyribodipyrimidine photolyase-related protein
MFSCTREHFQSYLSEQKKPFMKTFYERQRRSLNVLMDKGGPKGGKFSFDDENRKKLPKKIELPKKPSETNTEHVSAIKKLISDHFSDHPGETEEFVWPVTRQMALYNLNNFVDERLEDFGSYQDAMTTRVPFVFHSLISTSLNMGLITPDDVIERVQKKSATPINSMEGFIRQVIGWREFVRGIYHNYSEKMETQNHWNHRRKGKASLYSGESGIVPLDSAINKASQYGYCHHIERLMILANFFNLCEIEPKEVYEWFMAMFVDSAEWVMQANVYGMGLMSDGGIFATKPYISGSNYIRKMSDYKTGDWCEVWDGLYWRFIDRNKDKLKSNYRMAMMLKMLDKMDSEKKSRLFEKAEIFLSKHTKI